MVMEIFLLIFKFSLPPEDAVTEKWKAETAEIIFHLISKNIVVFGKATGESSELSNVFQN